MHFGKHSSEKQNLKYPVESLPFSVIPAQAGIQRVGMPVMMSLKRRPRRGLDPRLRGNDEHLYRVRTKRSKSASLWV